MTTLKYLNRDRFYPVVYCIGENGEFSREIEKIGVPVTALNKKLYLYIIGIVLELVQIFKKGKPNILHANLFYLSYFGRIAYGRHFLLIRYYQGLM